MMSDSGSSSSSDSSDDDLFDVCLPSVYPYRPPRVDQEQQLVYKYQVNPKNVPPVTNELGTYQPRGYATVAESLVWDPHRLLSSEVLESFLLYARRIHTTLSMGELLNLVREVDYDIQAAQLALVQPLLSTTKSTPPALNSQTPNSLDDNLHWMEVQETMERLYSHQHIKQKANQIHQHADLKNTGLINEISSINEKSDSRLWDVTISSAIQAIEAASQAVGIQIKKESTSNGKEILSPGPGRKKKAATPPAAAVVKESPSETPETEEQKTSAAEDGSESEDEEGTKPEPQVADPSFLYPWLQEPGFPTRLPAAPLIDILKLREIVQLITDANEPDTTAGRKSPASTSEIATMRKALLQLPPVHIQRLQDLHSNKNDWLDKVRPLLHQISRNKDNQTLEQVCEVLRELEQVAPCIDSRERRKCIALVGQVQEWRIRAQTALKQAAKIPTQLNQTGLVQYQPTLTHTSNSPAPASSSTASPTPTSVPFTLPLLTRLLKDCDKSCGCLASDESVFLRGIYEFVYNFVRQIETVLVPRIPETKVIKPEEAEEEKKSESKQDDEDAEMADGDEDDDDDEQAPTMMATRGLRNIRPERSPSPSPSPDTSAAIIPKNDYPPNESGALPAKLTLTQAKRLLARFQSHYQLNFQVPQVQILITQIERTEQWIQETEQLLRRTRCESETLADWLDLLNCYLTNLDELSIAVDVEPLTKGLRGRIWSAEVDQAFEVQSHAKVKDEEKKSTDAEEEVDYSLRGPTLEHIHELIEEAQNLSIPSTSPRLIRLQKLVSDSEQLIRDATALLSTKSSKVPVSGWQQLLTSIRQLPVVLDEETRIEKVIANTFEWHKKAQQILSSADSKLSSGGKFPYSALFTEIEALLNKTNGRSIAQISDHCSNPADNSSTFTELKALEDRIRLLLNLEKAERILADNTVAVPIPVPSDDGEEEKESDEAEADAAETAAQQQEPTPANETNEQTQPTTQSTATPPTTTDSQPTSLTPTANLTSTTPTPTTADSATTKENTSGSGRDSSSLTPHAKKTEMKELTLVLTELQKCRANKAIEPVPNQEEIWQRFEAFYKQLQNWIARTNTLLHQTETNSTLHSLLVLQTEFKNQFGMIVCTPFTDLQKRINNVVKWIPKERRALANKFRYTQLWKIQLDRATECGYSVSPYTLKVQAECTRIDDWKDRLYKSMDHKLGPNEFKELLKETNEGDQPILADLADIQLCEGFTELYCLCQSHYQDGVFMLQCDTCQDWFHETCVNLTQKVAEKIKIFKCPRCCQKENVPYKYGTVPIISAQQQREKEAAAAAAAAAQSQPQQQPQPQPPSNPSHATAAAIPATTVSAVPSYSHPGWSGMTHTDMADPMGNMHSGLVWPGGMAGPHHLSHQLMLQQHHQQQQQHHQQQAAAAAAHQQQQQIAASMAGGAGGKDAKNNKRKKSGALPGAPGPAVVGDSKKKKKAAGSASAVHLAGGGLAEDDSDRKTKKAKREGGVGTQQQQQQLNSQQDATVTALQEATMAASAAGVVGPMSLAVLQHEPLLSVPTDAPPPRTAALYATLLYENLHVQVTPENSNVLWHLLNGYMNRMFDSRLEEEILEAAKLVCGEQLLTDALLHVNPLYTAQIQLQWRQQQHMVAMQKAAHAQQHHQMQQHQQLQQQQHQAQLQAQNMNAGQNRQMNASATTASGAAAGGGGGEEYDSSGEEDEDGRPTTKKRRKPKNYPRAPLSAYKCFVRHLKTTPAPSGSTPHASHIPGAPITLLQNMQTLAESQHKTLNKLMSEKWRQLGKDQKKIFEDEAILEKEKYEELIEEWNQSHGIDASQRMDTTATGGGANGGGEEDEPATGGGEFEDEQQQPPLAASLQQSSYTHGPMAVMKAPLPSQAIVHASQPATTLLHHHHPHPAHHPMMTHHMYPFATNPVFQHYYSMQHHVQQQQQQQSQHHLMYQAQQQQAVAAAAAAQATVIEQPMNDTDQTMHEASELSTNAAEMPANTDPAAANAEMKSADEIPALPMA